jgi:DNA-binding beta-propeller fold protein YncE
VVSPSVTHSVIEPGAIETPSRLIVDLVTRRVVESIAVGTEPDTLSHVAGSRVVVALRGKGTSGLISVIESGRTPRAQRVPVGGTSTGHQAVSSDGRFAYVAVTGPSPGIAVLDLERTSVVTTWPTTPGGAPHGVYLDETPANS